MGNFQNWLKRFKSKKALTTIAQTGTDELAAASASIDEVHEEVKRLIVTLGRAHINEVEVAERVKAAVTAAKIGASTEFEEENRRFEEELNAVNRQFVADTEAVTRTYLAAKAAVERVRNTKTAALTGAIEERKSRLMDEQRAAQIVIDAANEVIYDPEQF